MVLVPVVEGAVERGEWTPNKDVKSVDPKSRCIGVWGIGEGLRVRREASVFGRTSRLPCVGGRVRGGSASFGRGGRLGFLLCREVLIFVSEVLT